MIRSARDDPEGVDGVQRNNTRKTTVLASPHTSQIRCFKNQSFSKSARQDNRPALRAGSQSHTCTLHIFCTLHKEPIATKTKKFDTIQQNLHKTELLNQVKGHLTQHSAANSSFRHAYRMAWRCLDTVLHTAYLRPLGYMISYLYLRMSNWTLARTTHTMQCNK